MKIKFKRSMWKVSKEGYYHAPILSFSFGSTGFAIAILLWSITVVWKEVHNG